MIWSGNRCHVSTHMFHEVCSHAVCIERTIDAYRGRSPIPRKRCTRCTCVPSTSVCMCMYRNDVWQHRMLPPLNISSDIEVCRYCRKSVLFLSNFISTQALRTNFVRTSRTKMKHFSIRYVSVEEKDIIYILVSMCVCMHRVKMTI